ncbi:outer membrane protein assembly factor BamB family protein [Nocardiopsis valliformis]|uniref:outer membrane protein assembly factor BamB family protein n=1 Tax=Nocardiopsis valliformis TaxID=239974 RepID=UPI000344EE0F|nr:PQQ-binding-like beta-propeller repeat protein [Nocardiopsis valliformis]
MGGRLGGVFGWAGISFMAWGVYLTGAGFRDVPSNRMPEELGGPLVFVLILALIVGGCVLLRSTVDPGDDPGKLPARGQTLARIAGALGGLALVVWTFPDQYLVPTVINEGYPLYPDTFVELWVGVCSIALGLALLVGASDKLPVRQWKRALAGLASGVLAVALTAALTPVLTRALTMEHSTVEAGREPEPVPAEVSQVGWTWQPEHTVVGVGRGALGPVIQYRDGFVALDGATGEELWTYRRPYARHVGTGFFAGNEDRAYFHHQESIESETRTLLVLDTSTGEVVRETSVPEPGRDGFGGDGYLTPEARVFRDAKDGRSLVVAHRIGSDEPIWEVPFADDGPGRWCTRPWGRELQGHGDRLLLTHVCLDEEHLPEGDADERNAVLRDLAVPDDAVRTLTVLDTDSGAELWRHEDVPESVYGVEDAEIHPARTEGARPVAATNSGLFDLETGEPVDALPEEPDDPDWVADDLIAADSEGAVVLRRYRDSEARLLLNTDSSGSVTRTVEASNKVLRAFRTPGIWETWDQDHAHALADAVLSTQTWRLEDDREEMRAVMAAPLGAGDPVTEHGLEWIGFDGERLSAHARKLSGPAVHRLLVVPGAVVSYIEGPEESEVPAPVHGLVP